jgi:hypothetical protein
MANKGPWNREEAAICEMAQSVPIETDLSMHGVLLARAKKKNGEGVHGDWPVGAFGEIEISFQGFQLLIALTGSRLPPAASRPRAT